MSSSAFFKILQPKEFRPFDGKSPAEKTKYIKTYFNENGPVIDIDLALFFELNDVKINLEYLDTISELVIKSLE